MNVVSMGRSQGRERIVERLTEFLVVAEQLSNLILGQVLGLGLRRRASDVLGLLCLLLRQNGGVSGGGGGALGRGH